MEKYPYLNEAIANVLSRRRAQFAVSKKKLSEEAGIARIHITHLEEGIKSPSMNVVFHLCEALGLEPEDFVHQVREEIKRLEEEDRSRPKPKTWEA